MQDDPKTSVYRVHTPLMAQARQDGGRAQFIAIPRGSVVVVAGNAGPLGLVEVDYNGKKLSVYRRDIEERAQKMGD